MTQVTLLWRQATLVGCILLLGLLGRGTAALAGIVATPEEMATAHRWIAAKVETPPATPRRAGLGRARQPRPGPAEYAGEWQAANDRQDALRPRTVLPCREQGEGAAAGAGKSFSAIVGVDTNDQTVGGRGSIEFSVSVGGKQAFHSAVLREGMPAVPVSVDLGGASELLLEVGDAGDGISCDQADWADAKVVLNDGTTVWLGDLPIVDAAPARLADPPFSFVYHDTPSAALLSGWNVKRECLPLDSRRTRHTVSYTDPKTHLVVRWVAIEYHDFPTVEWTLAFKNEGTTDTPLLSEVQAIDTRFQRGSEGEFLLHHNTGSPCSANDYQPHATPLGPKAVQRIATSGGRSTNSDMPYFNVEWPGQGVIAVLGWPGQWAAEFVRDDARGLRVRGGQELTRFKLHPGEEVRSPLAVVQFWQGDWIRSQNLWRRWMKRTACRVPAGNQCRQRSWPA